MGEPLTPEPFTPHDLGCQCYPHVSQKDAIEASVRAATDEYRAARAAAPAGETRVGPTCVLCPWSQDIGHEAHAAIIHPDDDLIVVEQMGQKFIVRREVCPRCGVGPTHWEGYPIGWMCDLVNVVADRA